MTTKRGKLLFLFLLLPGFVHAQYTRPGSTDAQFLKIGVSPRGTGMGDAYIAVVSGAEAVYYNTAALARVKGTDIVFNHNEWFAGINHEFAAIAHTFGRVGTLGISFTGLYTDEMKVRTPLQPDGTGETFYAGNYRAGLTYSRYLTDRVSIGVSMNYVTMSLYSGISASTYSVDVGALYVSGFRGFRFGMQIANFGSDVKFINESYPLPTDFTFGLAFHAIEGESQQLLLSISAVKPNDGQPLGHTGAEWSYKDFLFLRGGYRINYDVATYSFGGGVRLDINKYAFRVDYSYNDFSLLGAAHRFGVGVSF